MKMFNHTSICALVFLGSFVLFSSCKKEAAPIASPEQSLSMAAVNNTCKPIVLGATVQYPGQPAYWATLMQKWYGNNGKLAFLKANFFSNMTTLDHLDHTIQWGELLYYNNTQVCLREGRDTLMRVTLDAQQRPAASYYYHNHFPKGIVVIDTSYYHFTGNRLDSIISLRVNSYGGRSEFSKYMFFYDGYGNLVRIDRWDPRFNPHFTSSFMTYDYSQPVTDMVSVHQISLPYTVMEYMDLLHFPIHHRLNPYVDYLLLGNGLVSSYRAPGQIQTTFYTGWECAGSAAAADAVNRQKNNLNNLADFKKLYPQESK